MPSPKFFPCRWLIAFMIPAALALAPTLAGAETKVAALQDLTMVAKPGAPSAPVGIILTVDFVIILQIGSNIGSILLGNSAIADATLTDGRMVVLKGVSQGVTNMIILDTAGAKVAEFVVQVSARKPGTVTVRRAIVVQTYACLVGICESYGDSTGAAAASVAVAPAAN